MGANQAGPNHNSYRSIPLPAMIRELVDIPPRIVEWLDVLPAL